MRDTLWSCPGAALRVRLEVDEEGVGPVTALTTSRPNAKRLLALRPGVCKHKQVRGLLDNDNH